VPETHPRENVCHNAIVPWVALVLLFVGIRIGITVKRAVARRLQQPSATGADQP
jgi:hypothetical protein